MAGLPRVGTLPARLAQRRRHHRRFGRLEPTPATCSVAVPGLADSKNEYAATGAQADRSVTTFAHHPGCGSRRRGGLHAAPPPCRLSRDTSWRWFRLPTLPLTPERVALAIAAHESNGHSSNGRTNGVNGTH
jgi:hypothetical protein